MSILIIGKKESYAARRFREEGDRSGRQVTVISMSDLRFDLSRTRHSVFVGKTDIFSRFDAIFPLHIGPYFSETLILAEWAATRGVRVIEAPLAEGKYISSKTYDAWKLAERGLPIPASIQCMDMHDAEHAFRALGTPLVAKGVHGGQGRWVFKVHSLEELKGRLRGEQTGFFVFQKYLEIDQEYRIMTVGGKSLGAVRKMPLQGDFRRNYSLGAVVEHTPLTAELAILAETASHILGYAFAGVDIAISDGKPYILEVNRRPGFAGFEATTDINVAKAFIEYAWSQHGCGTVENNSLRTSSAYVASDRNRRPAECGEIHALHGHHEKTS